MATAAQVLKQDNTPQPTDNGGFGAMMRMMAGIISRVRLGRLTSFNGARDYNTIFGWDQTISTGSMLYMYNRGGIARRVVDAYPDAVWSRPPRMWAEGDVDWTDKWDEFTRTHDLWSAFHRLDRQAGLGRFAILVVGTDRPNLSTPLTRASKILYLQPYGEQNVRIEKYDDNPTSSSFGRPILYRVFPEGRIDLDISNTPLEQTQTVGVRSSFLVHASRVIHVAKNALEDDVFGMPLMAPVWDYLVDLRKVVGSSSESYWIMANRGIQADIDKEMSLGPADEAALSAEIDEYFHGFRRYMRTKGVKLKELQNDIADPKSPFEVLVTLIAGTSGIPKRVLIGSEAGQLASTQDKGNWAERVEENRSLHVEPKILSPFVHFCLRTGILPAPAAGSKMSILWPDAYRMSPLERGQTAAQTARTIANITKMFESKSEAARNLITTTEARALVGFPSDNRILADNPDP